MWDFRKKTIDITLNYSLIVDASPADGRLVAQT
jgi:hypothetical protein